MKQFCLINFLKNRRVLSNSSISLTLSRRRPLSYRNQSIDLLHKSMDWFLYDNGLRLERVNEKHSIKILKCHIRRKGSRKIAPSRNSNANPKPNPDPDRGAIFLGGNFPDTEEKMKKIKLQMNEQEILLQQA